MRRAGHQRTGSLPTTSTTPPGEPVRASRMAERQFENDTATTAVHPPAAHVSPAGTLTNGNALDPVRRAKRRRQIQITIRKRIETRLFGRVRNLNVRVVDDTVVLEGQCSTYYTKQLAQHAALGILEDEHLENAIVVCVSR
jgi:hypothetical protein